MGTGNYFGRGCVEDFRDACTCIPHTSGYACEEGSHLAWNAGRFLSEAPSLDGGGFGKGGKTAARVLADAGRRVVLI
ncbi:hypothetical protein, partial [Streptomyces sp. NPDC002159]